MTTEISDHEIISAFDAKRHENYEDFFVGFKPLDELDVYNNSDKIDSAYGRVLFLAESEDEAEAEIKCLGGGLVCLWGAGITDDSDAIMRDWYGDAWENDEVEHWDNDRYS